MIKKKQYLEAPNRHLWFFFGHMWVTNVLTSVAIVPPPEILWDYTAIVVLVNIIPQSRDGNETTMFPFSSNQTKWYDSSLRGDSKPLVCLNWYNEWRVFCSLHSLVIAIFNTHQWNMCSGMIEDINAFEGKCSWQ